MWGALPTGSSFTDANELRAVGLAPVVLAPRHLAGIGVQVAADAVVLADLGPAQAGEERLGLVGVHTLVMERDRVVDAPRVVVGVQPVPMRMPRQR
jgi:hypothetical protein